MKQGFALNNIKFFQKLKENQNSSWEYRNNSIAADSLKLLVQKLQWQNKTEEKQNQKLQEKYGWNKTSGKIKTNIGTDCTA